MTRPEFDLNGRPDSVFVGSLWRKGSRKSCVGGILVKLFLRLTLARTHFRAAGICGSYITEFGWFDFTTRHNLSVGGSLVALFASARRHFGCVRFGWKLNRSISVAGFRNSQKKGKATLPEGVLSHQVPGTSYVTTQKLCHLAWARGHFTRVGWWVLGQHVLAACFIEK